MTKWHPINASFAFQVNRQKKSSYKIMVLGLQKTISQMLAEILGQVIQLGGPVLTVDQERKTGITGVPFGLTEVSIPFV